MLTRFVFLLLVFTPLQVAAQLIDATAWVDNDYFNFWLPAHERPDRDYTHGLHVRLRFARNLGPVDGGSCPRSPTTVCHVFGITLGQHIFNPNVDGREPVPGERPYAGWLFVTAAQTWRGPRYTHTFGVTVGVTGRPSLAEPAQVQFHKWAGFREPLGWDHQLGFEPGVIVDYQYTRRLWEAGLGGTPVLAGEVFGAGAVGNVRTAARVGANVYVGIGVPDAGGLSSHPWALFGTGGVGGAVVVRDLFIDGNTFANNVSVKRRTARNHWVLGVTGRFRGFELSYRVQGQSREYVTEIAGHTVSTIAVRVGRMWKGAI